MLKYVIQASKVRILKTMGISCFYNYDKLNMQYYVILVMRVITVAYTEKKPVPNLSPNSFYKTTCNPSFVSYLSYL